MAGRLWISEYNNYGDPSLSLLLEPSTRVQEVAFGEVSEPLDKDTRLIALLSDLPCKVDFVARGQEPNAENATPMSEEYEITRVVHMGGGIRIAVFDRD